jgi:hypothetical protein
LTGKDGPLSLVNNYESKTLQNITRIDSSLKINNTVRLPVWHMASMPNGDLLLSTLETDLQICSQKTGQVQKSQYSKWLSMSDTMTLYDSINTISIGLNL